MTDNKPIFGVIRHILTSVGGYFVGTGIVDAATVEAIVGGVLAVAGVAWSLIEKKKA